MAKTATKTRKGSPRVSREEALAQRSEKLQHLADRLARWAESDHDHLRERYEGRFAHYSERNQDLLLMQAEDLGIDATIVRTFKGWLAEGRVVAKGQHGMTLLKPAGSKTEKAANASEERAAEASDPNASTADRIRKFFVPFTVFDISQTTPLEAEAAA